MTGRPSKTLLLLVLLIMVGVVWDCDHSSEANDKNKDKQKHPTEQSPAKAPGAMTPRTLSADEPLALYAEQLVRLLRAERARLMVWESSLAIEQEAIKKANETPLQLAPANKERLDQLTLARKEALEQRERRRREVEVLQTFLKQYRTQSPPTLQTDTMLDVEISVQWSMPQTELKAAPADGSSVLKLVRPDQPIVVIARVRNTTWRLVSAEGRYGFVAAARLTAR